MPELIYLDNNATTPLDAGVLEAMMPYLTKNFGNASSIHSAGKEARSAVESAREKVAEIIGAKPREVFFTSGGTESDNLAIFGVVKALEKIGKKHVITSAIEHHAVLEPVNYLKKQGYDVTIVGVNKKGQVDPKEVEEAIRPDTALVSIMYANNETGIIQPLEEIGRICKQKKVIFHTDAVQATGKIPVNVDRLNVDLLSLTAHKFYGPKGTGAIYIRAKTPIFAILHGGSHERKMRPGTENVAGIVGLAKALELATEKMDNESKRLANLRDYLEDLLVKKVGYVSINGFDSPRVPNTANVNFHFIEGESVLLFLDSKGVAASSGSACTSQSLEPSHVLTAMGIPPETAQGSIRFSLGKSTTKEQVEYVADALAEIVPRLREMSPLYEKFKRGDCKDLPKEWVS